ncbi:MAG: CaiB/BaiF CoA transferase family protein [Gammaproteobacteria bacterium]
MAKIPSHLEDKRTVFNKDFLVVELANILAGPTTSMGFAELGARVIKVENPNTSGDATRGWKLGNENRNSDISAYFACANWGKESIAVDFTTDAGREVVHDLIKHADIVVASFKPGDDKKLYLDYESAKLLNPKLIYGQINAYGENDPRPGFDAILQAEAGFTFLNGEPDGPPTKMPVALVDLLAAHQLKEGLLLALLKRERTGEGSFVSVSLLQAAVASLANQATNYLTAGVVPQRMGSEHPNIVPYGSILKCADEIELVIAAATERQFRKLMYCLGLKNLADDPQYATGVQRVERREELLGHIRAAAAKINADQLATQLRQEKVPFGYVNDMQAVFSQAGAKEIILQHSDTGSTVTGVRTVIARGDALDPSDTVAPPPHFDEHRQTILGQLLNYDESKCEHLAKQGAFGNI